MRQAFWFTSLALGVFFACSDPDLRDTKPDRTRDADGIIRLYSNREQGNWMLKGKVILVEAAVVVDALKEGEVIVTGRESFTPIPLALRFHASEKSASRLVTGDLVTFKGLCRGVNGNIRFESCVILGVTKPIIQP